MQKLLIRKISRLRVVIFSLLFCSLMGLYLNSNVLAQVEREERTSSKKHILYAFILDTSGSMVGAAGNNNIFPKVKSAVIDYLSDVQSGSSIYIFPFDRGIHDSKLFNVINQDDINKSIDFIQNLDAQGSNTYIYRSIKEAINKIYSFIDDSGQEHIVIIHLFTDGFDNDPTKQYSMADIIEDWNLKRKDQDWLYYRTLDSEIPSEARSVLEREKNVIIVEEERNEIHPLLQIDVRLLVLDFGNLKLQDFGSVQEKFIFHGKDKLPQNFKIFVESECPEVEAHGVLAEVKPNEFIPMDQVEFRLSLMNKQILETYPGDYIGNIHFKPSDPMVLIVPDKVEFKFRYEPEKTVKIMPSSDITFPEIDLGKINLFEQKDSVSIKKKILLEFNAQAQRSGGILKASCNINNDNPEPLLFGEHVKINDEVGKEASIEPPAKEVIVTFSMHSSLKSGEYSGTIRFQSDDFEILGESMKIVEDNNDIYEVSWKFEIAEQPMKWWEKMLVGIGILLVLLAILVVIFCAITGNSFKYLLAYIKKPIIENGTLLEIVEPKNRNGETIDISGKREVKIGEAGEYLTESKDSFTLKAEREEGKTFVTLSVNEGEVYLKKSDSKDEEIVYKTRVFDGDSFRFGKNIIRFSSYSLVR